MKLFFKKLGEGPALIILHGLFGSSDNWFSLGRRFAEDHQVYLVDLRNHGRSPHHPEMSYSVMAEDVLELMEAERLPSARLLGHSLGGKVAMTVALTRPERVEKLVVVDIAPRAYPPTHLSILQAMESLDLSRISSREEADRALSKTIPDPAIRAFLLKNLKRLDNGQFAWKVNLSAIRNHLPEIYAAIPARSVYQGPTLVVRGEKSDYIRPEDQALFRKYFPAARFVTIPGAGHWVHADNPQSFYQEVHAFLRQQQGTRDSL